MSYLELIAIGHHCVGPHLHLAALEPWLGWVEQVRSILVEHLDVGGLLVGLSCLLVALGLPHFYLIIIT